MYKFIFAFYGWCTLGLANAQDIDPCRYFSTQKGITSATEACTDSITANKWGLFEIELKPDLNLLFSVLTSKSCKVQANTFNRFAWQKAYKQTNVEVLAEHRVGGMIFPDSLRKLLNDELCFQINASLNSKKIWHPAPNVQAEVKTSLFKNFNLGNPLQMPSVPRGWLLPGASIISVGFRSEKPGKASLACGIAGLKVDWLRKNRIDSLLQAAYPNLTAPHYRAVNGGFHLTTKWNCQLGKYFKLEHSSHLFKPIYPQLKPVDIEMLNCLIFFPAKGLQTSVRQCYSFNQSLGTPPNFSGEIVMGYVFLKQKGKR